LDDETNTPQSIDRAGGDRGSENSMARKAYRDLPASLQAQVAAAVLGGDKTPVEMARQFGVDVDQIAEWRTQLDQSAKFGRLGGSTSPDEFPTFPTLPTVAKFPSVPNLPAASKSAAAPKPAADARPLAPLPKMQIPKEAPPIKAFPALPKRPLTAADYEEEATKISDFPTLWEAPPMPPPGTEAPAGANGKVSSQEPRTLVGARQVPVSAPHEEPQVIPKRVTPWTRKVLGSIFKGWAERQAAASLARELLQLYHSVAAEHPAISGKLLYRQIVLAHLGGTNAAADSLLRRASDSYARWPVERPLVFRDVVHYLVIATYFAEHASANWTRENVGRVIAKVIPETL
jgi:transposase-like protein